MGVEGVREGGKIEMQAAEGVQGAIEGALMERPLVNGWDRTMVDTSVPKLPKRLRRLDVKRSWRPWMVSLLVFAVVGLSATLAIDSPDGSESVVTTTLPAVVDGPSEPGVVSPTAGNTPATATPTVPDRIPRPVAPGIEFQRLPPLVPL
jgi:hypothetical protein